MGSAAARIPVTLLTGFLGSGKTTLLNGALRDPRMRGTAVVVNELGEIGLDHLLVAGSAENVVLLESGCLCCGLLNSLRETLLDLLARSLSGRLPPLRHIVVETTGLADPAPALQSLLRDPLVLRDFRLDGVVTTVDAVAGESSLESQPEARAQVTLADRLVVTKTDLTGGRVPAALRARLRGLNPMAGRSIALRGDDAALLEPGAGDGGAFACAPTSLPAAGPPPPARHGAGVRSASMHIPAMVEWAGLAGWIEFARAEFGPALLRCKGLVRVRGVEQPVLVQGVQGVFAAPRLLEVPPPPGLAPFLTFIHRGLDDAGLRASLRMLDAEP